MSRCTSAAAGAPRSTRGQFDSVALTRFLKATNDAVRHGPMGKVKVPIMARKPRVSWRGCTVRWMLVSRWVLNSCEFGTICSIHVKEKYQVPSVPSQWIKLIKLSSARPQSRTNLFMPSEAQAVRCDPAHVHGPWSPTGVP